MQKSNAGFYAFVAVLITAASFVFAWKSILPKYQDLNGQIKVAETETDAAKAKLESLDQTKKDLDSMGDLVDTLFVAVPSGADTPNLLTELEALFINQKFEVPNIQVSDSSAAAASGAAATTGTDSTAAAPSNAIAVSFSVTGDFEKLNNLIKALESDVRFMNIKNVTFSTVEDGKLGLAVQLEAYKQIQVSTDTTDSSAAGSSTASDTSTTEAQ